MGGGAEDTIKAAQGKGERRRERRRRRRRGKGGGRPRGGRESRLQQCSCPAREEIFWRELDRAGGGGGGGGTAHGQGGKEAVLRHRLRLRRGAMHAGISPNVKNRGGKERRGKEGRREGGSRHKQSWRGGGTLAGGGERQEERRCVCCIGRDKRDAPPPNNISPIHLSEADWNLEFPKEDWTQIELTFSLQQNSLLLDFFSRAISSNPRRGRKKVSEQSSLDGKRQRCPQYFLPLLFVQTLAGSHSNI